MGHGQISNQTESQEHRGHHRQAGLSDRLGPEEQGYVLQQPEGQPPDAGEESHVSFGFPSSLTNPMIHSCIQTQQLV